ncbi:MAG: hypothetical protein WA294_13735 [Acidobacteriaceae bacterium]
MSAEPSDKPHWPFRAGGAMLNVRWGNDRLEGIVQGTDRNVGASILLFFTAPLVAEFLLGDIGIKAIAALIVLAPMYGGGALLLREMARRRKLGWSHMLLLGVAYALIEEGYTTMSLFNPDYLQLHMHFLAHAWIPALGIGAWWTLFMLNLHTFWSMSVSIALVEGLFPEQREKPWLGKIGESAVGALFLLGCLMGTAMTLHQDRFVASRRQFAGTAVLVVLLLALALRKRSRSAEGVGKAPAPWITGAAALALGMGVLMVQPAWNWGAFAAMLALDAIFLVGLAAFARRAGWSPLHTLSLGAGGAFAYGIHAFWQAPVIGGEPIALLRAGNAIFLLLVALLVVIGARRTARKLNALPLSAAV